MPIKLDGLAGGPADLGGMLRPRQDTSTSQTASSTSTSSTQQSSTSSASSTTAASSSTAWSSGSSSTSASITTSTGAGSWSTGSTGNSQPPQISVSLALGIIGAIGGLVLLFLIIVYRRQATRGLRRLFGKTSPSNGGDALPRTSTGASLTPSMRLTPTADQLAGSSPASGPTLSRLGASFGAPTPGSETSAERRALTPAERERRYRQRIRRTESGRSVMTLPAYSKEAGDEELVLFRRNSRLVEDDSDTGSEGDMDLGEQQMMQRSLLPPLGVTAPCLSPVPESAQRSDEATGATTLELSAAASDDVVPHTAPMDGSAATRLGSIHRRGWGEAPTYLEVMSSPAFPSADLEAGGVPPPRAASNSRERTTSTFFGFFNRSPWRGPAPLRHSQAGSQASLLLQPQTSRLSARSYSTSGGAQSPWDSTQSLRISSPLPNSAVRASFEILPRAGLSEQQMRFIASSDALQTVGVSLADSPRRGRRRASSAMTSAFLSDDPATPPIDEDGVEDRIGQGPPSWQAVDEERRRQEAEGRRGLAGPSQVAAGSAQVIEREVHEPASAGPDGSDGGTGQKSHIANDSDPEQAPGEADAGSSTTAGPPQLPQLDIPSGLTVPAPSLRLQPPTPVIP